MSDFYAGQDLLADVFEGTLDAPEPVPVRDSNPVDPRWSVRMWRWPNGDVRLVHSIEPRPSDRPEPSRGSPSTDPGGFVGVRTQREAANGHGSGA